jgi:hypothetical protein
MAQSMRIILRPICWILGHDYTQCYDVDTVDIDIDGDPVFGLEYIDHYWCERCDKIERA